MRMPEQDSNMIPEHFRPVEFMDDPEHYVAFQTLDEARQHLHAVVIMTGDYGGQVYLTCPVSKVCCSEGALRELLNALAWLDRRNGEQLTYEVTPVGAGVSGGQGGGEVITGVWLHSWFDGTNLPSYLTRDQLQREIEEVIAGVRPRIAHEPSTNA
jgi:hypothetical protein